MSKNLKTQWRVQVRKSRAHKWVNKGLFETRRRARQIGEQMRWRHPIGDVFVPGYGFGNTRVVKYVRAGK